MELPSSSQSVSEIREDYNKGNYRKVNKYEVIDLLEYIELLEDGYPEVNQLTI